MVGRVAEDHHLAVGDVLPVGGQRVDQLEHGAPPGRVGGPVGEPGQHVVVAAERVEAQALVVVQRRLVPQPPPGGVGVEVDDRVVGVVRRGGHCGAQLVRHGRVVAGREPLGPLPQGGRVPLAVEDHDEAAVPQPVDHQVGQLVQGLHRHALGLQVGHRHGRRGAGPLPGQLGRAVAVRGPQPGVEQAAARRVEHGGPHPGGLGGELGRQALGQAGDRALGGGVHGRLGHRGDRPVGGGGVDHDALLAAGQHAGHERLDAVGHAEHVHAEGPRPVVGGRLPDEAAGRPDAGVVAQHVDRPVGGVGGLGQRLDRGGRGHVGGHADHVGAAARQVGDGPVEGALLDVGQHEPHALGGEPLGQGPPDAAGAAGDDGDLPLQLHQLLLGHRCTSARAGPMRSTMSWTAPTSTR